MSLGSLRKTRPWIGIAMVVAVLGSFAVACGDGDLSGPEATIQKMFDAMEAKDIEAFVAKACMDHSRGLDTVERIYNRNTLNKKRREALKKWSDYVDLLVTERDNVAVLHR